jgi:hypothetical protein
MARGAGVAGVDAMSHDELVVALREAGLTGPPDAGAVRAPDPATGVYHGEGVGRREAVDGTGEGGT